MTCFCYLFSLSFNSSQQNAKKEHTKKTSMYTKKFKHITKSHTRTFIYPKNSKTLWRINETNKKKLRSALNFISSTVAQTIPMKTNFYFFSGWGKRAWQPMRARNAFRLQEFSIIFVLCAVKCFRYDI